MACRCKHYLQEIQDGKETIEDIRELFIKRMTVDSDHNDRRRKDYNQAIFHYDEYRADGTTYPVFFGTDMDMVLQCFDDAVKDWRRSWCDVENCRRVEK